MLQTGSGWENIGRVDLTYDTESDTVTAYTQRNVCAVSFRRRIRRRTSSRRAPTNTYPRVAEVKEITEAAIAEPR